MYFAELFILVVNIFIVVNSAKTAVTRYQKTLHTINSDRIDRSCQEWRAFLKNIETLETHDSDQSRPTTPEDEDESSSLEELIEFSSRQIEERCFHQVSHYQIFFQNQRGKKRNSKSNNYWIRRLKRGEN